EGKDVRCLVRDRRKGKQLESWGCELAVGDVTERRSLDAAVAGCDAVIHLVSIIVGRRRDFELVMEQGTRNLVDAASAAGVHRFLLISALGTSEARRQLGPAHRAQDDGEP